MVRKLGFLILLAMLVASCTKEEPATPQVKKNPDLGTQGGATQVGMEPH